jgi:hypothetical protein
LRCISVPVAGSSRNSGRLSLAGLLMGTFRGWFVVNAGAPMAVMQALPAAVFKLGVAGKRRPPDATILQPTVAVSAAGNRRHFQVCAADLDLVGRPYQRLDASSLAIFFPGNLRPCGNRSFLSLSSGLLPGHFTRPQRNSGLPLRGFSPPSPPCWECWCGHCPA